MFPALAGATAFGFGASGCDSAAKESQQIAIDVVKEIAPAIPKDVDNVKSGLVDGAKLLATLLPPEGGDLKQTREAIANAREKTDAIRLAPASFFCFANTAGKIVRSEHDPDELADRDLFGAFPELKKSVEGSGAPVEAFGEMAEMRRVHKGDELVWIDAVPVLDKDGKPRGAFAAGWSFRWYATYLDNQAKRFLDERAKKSNQKVPIMYSFIVKSGKAYGGQETPDASAEAVAKLDVASKVKSGMYQGRVEITGWTFGIAALSAADRSSDLETCCDGEHQPHSGPPTSP